MNSQTKYLSSLGISQEIIDKTNLVLFPEPKELVVAEQSRNNRSHRLTPSAANAWMHLKQAAVNDGEYIFIISAFRSVEQQTEIIEKKLNGGQIISEILKVSAVPGYSEHHSGRAIDIGANSSRPLEEEFSETSAFKWLQSNANCYGYTLSYPKDNIYGYDYEPWHWCYQDA